MATLTLMACSNETSHHDDHHEESAGTARQADFTNGGFENGTLSGWTVQNARNGDGNGSGIPTFPPTKFADLGLQRTGLMTNLTTVVSSSTAGYPIPAGLTSADSLRYPFRGNDSVVVNRQGNNANVNYIQQSMTVTASDVDPSDGNVHVRFAVAPVLNNPTHQANQQPYFFIEINNTTKNQRLYYTFNFANQPGVAWKTAATPDPTSGAILYTDWQAFDLAPGPAGIAIGDTIQATVVGAGCAYAQHWGEVYVDDFGTTFALPNVNVSAPAFVNQNSNLTYTVLVKNGGTAAATNVIVDFTTPQLADSSTTTQSAATTFQSLTAAGATCTSPAVGASGKITCNIGSLSPGGSYSFTVTVAVPTVPGTFASPVYVNEGSYDVKSDQTAILNGGLVQTQITTSTPVDLEATLDDGVPSVIWGQQTTYTYVVKNAGTAAVNNIAITDTRPSQLTGVTWTCAGSGGGTCGAASGSGASISTTASLPAGASVTYTIKGTMTGGPLTANVTYSVTAAPPGGSVQSVPFHNIGSDTDQVSATQATLTVNKDAASTGSGTVISSPAGINCGTGCTTASAKFATNTFVSVSAVAPPGQTFVGWSGACTGLTNPCNITLAVDTTLTARFDAPTVSGVIAATSNSNSTNVRPGDTVDYKVTINIPNNSNTGLKLNDVFPTGLTYVSATTPATTGTVSCTTSGGCTNPVITSGTTTSFDFGAVTCTTAAGCTISFNIRGQVATTATRGTVLTDAVNLTGLGSSNLPAVTVIEPNLTVSRTASPSTGVARGAASTITVTLANNSGGANAPAYAVVAAFPIPANATAGNYVQGTCPAATATFTGGNATFTFPNSTTPTLAAGASCTFTYQLTVAASAPGGSSIASTAASVTSQSISGTSPPAKQYLATDSGVSFTTGTLSNGTGCAANSECTSNVCDTDGKCGYANGDGPCNSGNAATVCRSGACSASNKCVAAGGCLVDGDCTSSQFCDTSAGACTAKLTNGAPIPTIAGHTPALNGTCSASVGTAVCIAGVCDPTDNSCGIANGGTGCTVGNQGTVCRSGTCDPADGSCGLATGDGPCTPAPTGSTTCRSGACSTSGQCEPAGGCLVDADCTSANFCNTQTRTCTPKLANGTAIPTITGHSPALTGVCSAQVASSVCTSGACDPADNKCGLVNGDGTCTSTSQCRTGQCITVGTNSGKCEPCANDSSCSGTTPACNTSTNQCVACTAGNTTGCTGTTPICNTAGNTCLACNGDNGVAGATRACPDSNAPFCAADGSCGKCTANSDCAGSTHGGAICNTVSGACGSVCTVDTDCPNQWCNNPTAAPGGGTCAPKVPNGQPIPSSPPLNGVCTTGANGTGARVCASAVCDPIDNICGEPNGRPCTSATVCRSNVCNADGNCGDPNGTACTTATTCRSGICDADGKCGEINGETCANPAECRSGFCVATDNKCGEINGSPCTANGDCRSNVCFTDTRCGLPNGETCTTGVTCRSGACVNGRCGGACTQDSQCASGEYCDSGACIPALPNGQTCARATQCLSNVCNADGKCGDPDGTACTSATTCRSGACNGGVCGSGCATDADCATGTYCDANLCKPAQGNSDPCTRARQCATGVCASDNKCGEPDGGPCTAPTVCRSNVCDSTNTCVSSCAKDADCAAGTWCNATTHACDPSAANGDKPDGNNCTRGAQCLSGVCDSDGACGEINGETCGSRTICRSDVCDPTNGKCGIANGNGPCTAGTATTVCQSQICDNGKCGYANGDGPCTSGAQCASGKCDATTQKCVGCTADNECTAGQYCDKTAGACKATLPDGSACDRATECTTGQCNGGKCGAGATDAGVDGSAPGDAGADSSTPQQDASLPPADSGTHENPDATLGSDAADAGNPSDTWDVSGGGLSCAMSTSNDGDSGFAIFGLVAVGAMIATRRRKAA